MSTNSLFQSVVLVGLVGITVPTIQGCRSNTSASQQIDDSAITASVKAKMIGDNDVKANNVDVNTEEGIVYLMGRVDTQAEKAEAERIARSCDGVRDVVNHLEVGSAK